MERLEQLYVEKTLRVTRNNKTRAASMLGISRKALYDKLNRWERKKKGLRPLREQLKSPPAAD
jgi:DNA-binding NtrC family response regulator